MTNPLTSPNHPTVDLPAHLEGPRLPTSYDPAYPYLDEPDTGAYLRPDEEAAALADVRTTLDLPTFPGRPE